MVRNLKWLNNANGQPPDRKGIPLSEKHRLSLCVPRTQRSKNHCLAISIAKKGKPGKLCSKETREKMSISRKGRIHSKETRKAISISNTGQRRSKETRRKMSAAYIYSEERNRASATTRKGKIYITNGVSSKMVIPDTIVPDGWRIGRQPRKSKNL